MLWRTDLLELGIGLLLTTTVAAIIAAILPSSRFLGSVAVRDGLSRTMISAAFLCASAALAIFANASLSSDFTYEYVWEHTSSDLEPVYRFSAIWAGGQGALLVCSWFIGLVLFVESALLAHRREVSPGFRATFTAVMALLLAFFSIVSIMSGLFDRTSSTDLLAHPNGMGMDVSLQTPEMVFHAPLIFAAYAALSAVFAASVSYCLSRDLNWVRVSLPWGRVAWLTLSSGILLGAIWAYYVIGWGGYWSWDPVETSSLIPWLMVTAFLHTQIRHMPKGEYRIGSPLLGMMAFVGVAFVSFVVRAGGIWSSSVHDYGISGDANAASRLLSALQQDATLAGTFAFLIVLLIVSGYLSFRAHSREEVLIPTQSKSTRLADRVSDQNTMFLTVVLLAMTALAAVLLMVRNVDSDLSAASDEFNQKMSVFFVALMVALGLCLTWTFVGRQRALAISAILILASVVSGALATVTGAIHGLVAFCAPSFLFALWASMYKLGKSISTGPVRDRLFRAGAQIAHLGLALMLLGYVASTNLQTHPEGGPGIPLTIGGEAIAGDYTIRLDGLQVSGEIDGYEAGVVEVRTAFVDVLRDGRLVLEDARLEILYGYESGAGLVVLERVAFVRSTLLEDLYMSFIWMTDEVAILHVKVVPMMRLLWAGAILMLIGISMRVSFFSRRSL